MMRAVGRRGEGREAGSQRERGSEAGEGGGAAGLLGGFGSIDGEAVSNNAVDG